MKATIVTIGDEILIGQILDTNSQWLSQQLYAVGIEVVSMVSIADAKEAIEEALYYYPLHADLVIFTGGLGPTKDDITKHVLVEFFKDELVFDVRVFEHIRKLLTVRGIPVVDLHHQQAQLPSKAKVLFNQVGTAAGMWFATKEGGVVCLPGVPFEMKNIVTNQLIPALTQQFKLPFLYQQTMVVYGVPESELATHLLEFEEQMQTGLSLAYLPSPGRVRLRLSGKGAVLESLKEIVNAEVIKLKRALATFHFEVEEEDILTFIQRWMEVHQKTLAVAESCTGGKIAAEIVQMPGASAYFKAGIVAYTSVMKKNLLKVSEGLLKEFSVVSAEVAVAMAKGILQETQADFAIATTGNAGPTTEPLNDDLGVVFIAIASIEGVVVEKFNFGQPREKVIEQAKNKAFELLKKEILKKSR